MNEYRELTKNIRAPHGLHRQVLAAVEKHENMCLHKRKGQTLMRTAVCTACALALLLGTWTLHTEPVGEHGEGAEPGGVGIPVAEYTFALTAYAAENTVNGGIAILWENGCGKFRVAGSGVRQIVFSVDHGVLLRNGEEVVAPLTDAFDPETVYGLMAGRSAGWQCSDADRGIYGWDYRDLPVSHYSRALALFYQRGRRKSIDSHAGW